MLALAGLEVFEYRGDGDLAVQVPGADRLVGLNVLLAVRARHHCLNS